MRVRMFQRYLLNHLLSNKKGGMNKNQHMQEMNERKATTRKGKRYLKQFESQINEGPRNCIILKGTKTSEKTSEFLKIWVKELLIKHQIRKNLTKPSSKRNDIKPFEDHSSLEFLAERNLCPLFVFGKHSKKRPECVVLGRIFERKLLDMVEFQITKLELINNDKSWNIIPMNAVPMVLFHGPGFETDPHKMRIKNLLHDMFNRNVYLEEADITSVARFVISVIEDNDTIHLRFYSASLLPSQLTDGSWNNKGNLEEVGAKIDLKILRKSLAEESIYKRAVKYQPYWAEKKKKNIEYTGLGDKMGRVHVKQADLKTLQIRKNKSVLEKRKKESNETKDGEKKLKE